MHKLSKQQCSLRKWGPLTNICTLPSAQINQIQNRHTECDTVRWSPPLDNHGDSTAVRFLKSPRLKILARASILQHPLPRSFPLPQTLLSMWISILFEAQISSRGKVWQLPSKPVTCLPISDTSDIFLLCLECDARPNPGVKHYFLPCSYTYMEN